MAEDKRNGHPDGCMCLGCHGGHGRHWTFFLLRTLITIIILMMVFWFGVAAGRLSGAGIGRFEMMGGRYMPAGYGGGAMPMMPVNGATSTPSATGGVQNY